MIIKYQYIMNAISALARLFWNLARRKHVLANKLSRTYRKRLCQACPYQLDRQCLVCGCYTPVKTVVASEACPLGYWPRVD